jgi:hypothetical protein
LKFDLPHHLFCRHNLIPLFNTHSTKSQRAIATQKTPTQKRKTSQTVKANTLTLITD